MEIRKKIGKFASDLMAVVRLCTRTGKARVGSLYDEASAAVIDPDVNDEHFFRILSEAWFDESGAAVGGPALLGGGESIFSLSKCGAELARRLLFIAALQQFNTAVDNCTRLKG